MARVTGIGGVFFKSTSDHQRLAAWYRDNLGLALEAWGGAILKWPEDQAKDGGQTVWHVAERDSKWFSPSTSSFMINYRVDDLTALLAYLKGNGVEVVSMWLIHHCCSWSRLSFIPATSASPPGTGGGWAAGCASSWSTVAW